MAAAALARLLWRAAATLLITGCMTTGDAPPRAREGLERGDALVFFGFDETMPEKRFEMRPGRTAEPGDVASLSLQEVITGNDYQLHGLSFDGPDGDQQWIAALVPPGTYFLKVVAPLGRPPRPHKWDWRTNRYLLHVREGDQAVYGGTFLFECTATKLFFGEHAIGPCSGEAYYRVDADLASRAFGDWPAPPDVRIAILTDLNRSDAPGMEQAAVRAQVSGPQVIVPDPDWATFDRHTRPEPRHYLGTGIAVRTTDPLGSSGGCYGGGCIGLAMLYGAIKGVAWAADSIGASMNRSEWSDCFADIRTAVDAFPVVEYVARRWLQMAPAGGTNPLTLDIYRVILRKCGEPKTVCAEIAMRARLIASEPPGFEKFYLYTADEFRFGTPLEPFAEVPAHPWWETPVTTSSFPRPITDYCSDAARMAAEETERGMDALMSGLQADLHPRDR